MYEKILYEIILTVLIPALFGLIGIGIKYGIPFITLKLADTKLAVLLNWIDKMVKAAEQKWSSSGMGESKKNFVTTIITKIVSLFKLGFTDDEIDALIEATVKEMNDTVEKTLETVDNAIPDSTTTTTESK